MFGIDEAIAKLKPDLRRAALQHSASRILSALIANDLKAEDDAPMMVDSSVRFALALEKRIRKETSAR